MLICILFALALAQNTFQCKDEKGGLTDSFNCDKNGNKPVQFSDDVLLDSSRAMDFLQKVLAKGLDFARLTFNQMGSKRFIALLSLTEKEASRFSQTTSKAWVDAITSQLINPVSPNWKDKGTLDGIVTRLASEPKVFLSLLLPNLFEKMTLPDSVAGNQEIELHSVEQARLARLLDVPAEEQTSFWGLKGFLPRHRRLIPGDWKSFNSYVDGVTGSVLRTGKATPLFNGGYIPEAGRPTLQTEKFSELLGQLEARHLHTNYKLKVEDAQGCFPRAFKMIDEAVAGDPIYLSIYVFQSDEASWMIAKKLIEAKKRGCDVQVVYDAAGSGLTDLAIQTSAILRRKSVGHGATSESIYTEMRNAGIPVITYPIGKVKSQLNHKKLLIIGGGPNSKKAAVGFLFINVGTEYFAIWDDFGWLIEGPAVADMMRDWERQKARIIERMPRENWSKMILRPSASSKYENEDLTAWYNRLAKYPAPAGSLNTLRVVDHVGLQDQTIKVIGIAALKVATRRIRIVCPYVTDPDYLNALIAAGKRLGRGKVTLLIPANNDMYQTKGALWTWYSDLLAAGVEVRESYKHMVHSKVKITDDLVEGGSSNLDARSLWNNDESIVSVEDRAMADLVESKIFREPSDKVVDLQYLNKLKSNTVDWVKAVMYRKLDNQL